MHLEHRRPEQRRRFIHADPGCNFHSQRSMVVGASQVRSGKAFGTQRRRIAEHVGQGRGPRFSIVVPDRKFKGLTIANAAEMVRNILNYGTARKNRRSFMNRSRIGLQIKIGRTSGWPPTGLRPMNFSPEYLLTRARASRFPGRLPRELGFYQPGADSASARRRRAEVTPIC